MDTTHELWLPSEETRLTLTERSGIRGRLDTLKSRGLSKVHDVQRSMRDRRVALKGSLADAQTSLRDGARSQYVRVNESMRNSPMKWAGIAAASGFGLGLIGRVAQWRNKTRRVTPDLIIIESGC